jgi:hypothetical protein
MLPEKGLAVFPSTAEAVHVLAKAPPVADRIADPFSDA